MSVYLYIHLCTFLWTWNTCAIPLYFGQNSSWEGCTPFRWCVSCYTMIVCFLARVSDQHKVWLRSRMQATQASVMEEAHRNDKHVTQHILELKLDNAKTTSWTSLGCLPSSTSIPGIDQVFLHHGDNLGRYIG